MDVWAFLQLVQVWFSKSHDPSVLEWLLRMGCRLQRYTYSHVDVPLIIHDQRDAWTAPLAQDNCQLRDEGKLCRNCNSFVVVSERATTFSNSQKHISGR